MNRAPIGRLSAAAFAGMFVFGIVMALLGAVLPELSKRLVFSLSGIGTLFLLMNATMLVTCLALGAAMDRFGMKTPMAAGPWLVALALISIAHAGAYSALLPAVVLLGLGGGALNGATNTLVADLHEDPRKKNAALNVLGIFFGFGALCLPFTLGALTRVVGMAGLLYGAAALCALAGCYALALRFPAPKQAQRLPLDAMPRFLRMPVVLAMAFLLFFQSGNEFVLGGYFSTFLTRELGVQTDSASYLLAAYWASIMAARVVLSRLLLRAGGHAVILCSALVAAAGTAGVAAAPGPGWAVAWMMLSGAALSGIFPTLLGIAGARFKEHSGTVFGILLTVALTGGMLMPWLAGHLAESFGLRWVFVQTAACFGAIALLIAAARRAGQAAPAP